MIPFLIFSLSSFVIAMVLIGEKFDIISPAGKFLDELKKK